MQEMKTRHSTGELISRTEAAEILGVPAFSKRWYDTISQPNFPRVKYTSPADQRGCYKRSEIERWLKNL